MSLKNVFRGWLGEKFVSAINWLMLDGSIYKQLNNVTLELADGSTTQIDHLIISKFGIFVVETKDMKGWIFGDERDSHWTQCFENGKKYRFQNPIRQNYRHMCSLIEFLNGRAPGLNLSKSDIEKKIFSVVFFGPDAEIRTPEKLPDGVNMGAIRYIKTKSKKVFTDDQVKRIVSHIKDGKLPNGLFSKRKTHKKHLASLEERHSRGEGDPCPHCGKTIVVRKRKKDGQVFLGCSGFPSCRFKKPVSGDQKKRTVSHVKEEKLPYESVSDKKACKEPLPSSEEQHRQGEGDPCPRCGKTIVVRKRKKDGQEFLGCSGFPSCRFMKQLPSTQ